MAAIKFSCPHCAQHLEAPQELAGVAIPCPVCERTVEVPVGTVPPAPAPPALPRTAGQSPVCTICLTPIGADEARTACPACRAEYHAECWQENGGCAMYGCSQVPVVEQRHAVEIPVSFWGQENKACPACKREILAAAVRCRHCGATFTSARPEGTGEFHYRAALEQRLPATRSAVIWLFVLSMLPCLAPIGAVVGVIWYSSHHEDVKALPSLYLALYRIGLGVAIGQTVTLVVMGLLYSALRHS